MFNFIDRGKNKWIMLLPGWATDYRIFDSLDLDYNYILPTTFEPENFENEIYNELKNKNISKISILGWSMGGFAAVAFNQKYPDLVDNLILISVRKQYISDEIQKIKEMLKQNKKAYLFGFYSQCFEDKTAFKNFKNTLAKDYYKLSLKKLLSGLAYLKQANLGKISKLENFEKVTILHGSNDKIAPAEEAIEFSKLHNISNFRLIENAGHNLLYETDIRRYFR
ncbi:alpha/beta fold hydrolase [bacterium]